VRRCIVVVLALLAPLVSFAHEVRPSYLEMHETAAGEFTVLWKTPMQGDARLALEPAFGSEVVRIAPVATRRTPGAAVQTWAVRTPALRGQTLAIDGLEGTMTDALARIEFADGSAWTHRFTPGRPSTTIPLAESAWTVAGVYFALGVEHILTGIDHLLFVLALVFVARGRWSLVKTVTAFTVAHSITLGLATLGVVHVPAAPVEAVIALSIAFVAVEIVRGLRGRPGITARAPWIVAFAFGLLHGFGFAGALAEVGLPERHIPLALLFFNVGVEAGQLAFVAVVLCAGVIAARAHVRWPGWARLAPAYAIGSVGMFWVLQRVAAF
jgi:hydrogenase/urease accessory protein HupE